MNDAYASWLNRMWLKDHCDFMRIYKPTDRTDPQYEERIKIWQNMLAIPSTIRNEIKKKHGMESQRIAKSYL